jgi:secreted trypsin-like serine protease
LLKVRVGEYDASGFNPPEAIPHQEYTVVKILKHPNFDPARLHHGLAILTLEKAIDLNSPVVNTVCLPSCDDQFDFRFNNGTGTRCWVAGWGKNATDGTFQFLQHKVDIPLVDNTRCNAELKAAINAKKSGVGNKFSLDGSEICAGGEVGKDACTGDGGSPLVCQANSGRWTVVGLVTWGVGCATNTPGVYARISYFRDWINAN